MKFFQLLAQILCVSLTACQMVPSHQSTSSKYHEDGRAKPAIAFVPVTTHCSQEMPWPIEEEFSFFLRSRFNRQNQLYSAPADHTSQLIQQIDSETLSSKLLSIASRFYPGHDFVLFLELLEHTEKYDDARKDSVILPIGTLSVKARIRVIDLRSGNPKLILQEIIARNYHIKSFEGHFDYSKIRWDAKEYHNTAWYKSHRLLEKDIVERVQHYISLAKG